MFRRIRTPALALAVAMLLTACGSPEETRRRHEEAGDRYMAGTRPHEAIIEYRKALQADSAYAPAHRKLAKAYLETSDPARALESFARAAELDTADV